MRRHVPLEGQPNFRDLGGYSTVDGATVRWGVLFRSGELGGLTPADKVEVLDVIGLRHACDLRSAGEVEHAPNTVLPADAITHVPISNPTAADPMAIAHAVMSGDLASLDIDMPVRGNRQMVLDHTDALATALEVVMDPDNWPIMINCTAGKDRTGLVSALALLSLGVPTDTVSEDYLLSSRLLAQQSEARIVGIRSNIARTRGCDPADVPDDELEVVRALMDVRPHYIAAAFSAIDEQYGSIDRYLREGLGVDDERVQRFRAAALD